MRSAEPGLGFGQRFARNMAGGLAGIGLFCMQTVVVDGGRFPFVAVTLFLLLSYWFRRRAMLDERRRDETLEDERDRAILASGDRAFRFVASMGFVVIALVLALPSVRPILLEVPLRLPGLLLMGLIVANVAGHAAVWRCHAKAAA